MKKQLNKLISILKTIYEDEWKSINLINTSIKLPLTLYLSAKNYEKIQLFEKTLESLDLISEYMVFSFNSEEIVFKIWKTNQGFSNIFEFLFYKQLVAIAQDILTHVH